MLVGSTMLTLSSRGGCGTFLLTLIPPILLSVMMPVVRMSIWATSLLLVYMPAL